MEEEEKQMEAKEKAILWTINDTEFKSGLGEMLGRKRKAESQPTRDSSAHSAITHFVLPHSFSSVQVDALFLIPPPSVARAVG